MVVKKAKHKPTKDDIQQARALLKHVDKSKARLAAERDTLRGLIDDLTDIVESIDYGLESIDDGKRRFEDGLDYLSQYV